MTHTRKNKGVCSLATTVKLEDQIIQQVEVVGGCDGNLKGICALLTGRTAQDAIDLLQHITCDSKSTSCPAQIALCLQEAVSLQG